jgi:hypothetical protein
LPPTPTGHWIDVPSPTLDFHSALTLDRKLAKLNVVPEPSERCTTLIAASPSFRPGLSAASAGSFHFWILPR